MASSRVMATTTSSTTSTSTISDLPSSSSSLNYFHHNHHHSYPNLNHNHNHNHHSNHLLNRSQMIPDASPMNVDSLFSNDNDNGNDIDIGKENLLDAEITVIDAAGAISAVDCGGEASTIRRKTVEDVWREIVVGERKECKVEAGDELMTLEDFLARATAEEDEEDVDVKAEGGIETGMGTGMGMGMGMGMEMGMYSQGMMVQGGGGVFPMGAAVANVVGEGGRRKRSRGSGGGVMMEPLDKAAQQRQRRMIKNRESAARSRERKQAYQVELEALAAKLEEENEQLLKEKADRTKQRHKQLMEKIVPVVEKRKPPRTLRRVRSMQW